ncbi:MAG: ATP-dependent zinc metalloprotease FtsH [Firmicutes bacterium]|nr:ATP-dependent zinc metalloprotease FtsH [Bacillota bacterium]
MKSSRKNWVIIVVLVLVIALIAVFSIFSGEKTKDMDYSTFQVNVLAGNVDQASIANDTMYVQIKGDKTVYKVFVRDIDVLSFVGTYNKEVNDAVYQQAYDKAYAEELAKFGIDVNDPDSLATATQDQLDAATQQAEAAGNKARQSAPVVKVTLNDRYKASFWDYFIQFLPILLMIVVAVFLVRVMMKSNGGAMSFGKTDTHNAQNSKVRFGDVAGADEEKEELKEIVEFLKAPGKFTAVGARIPKGVLLVGPPGTGKTLFAKAVAGEAGVPFFAISGSDFVEMFVGVGASRVRDLFEKAKKNMPCIIFIDEIDAVGRQRGAGLGGGHDEREQTLNQLLVHMDGFVANEGIIVMAATNRADILDPALLRPGRFDRQIYVNKPDVKGREAIFKIHSRNKPLEKEVEFKTLARLTSGFSGADIENLLNEAAILCARDGRQKITSKDVYEGINKVVLGPQKKSRLVTEVDKRNTAYHEAGHAIVARSLQGCDPVHEVSIIPRGQAAGYTMMRPDNDDNGYTVGKLTAMLAMTMGGRAAEEIVIHDFSAGAAGDIKSVTSIARKMVTEWGMSSEIGPMFLGGEGEVFLGKSYGSHSNTSEQMTAKIDAEVKKLIDTAHQKALEVLTEKRQIMDNMARVLVERETIYAEEVSMLMDGKSVAEVLASIDAKGATKDKDREQVQKIETVEIVTDNTQDNP